VEDIEESHEHRHARFCKRLAELVEGARGL
jgi:hypothetical protein